MSPVIIITSLKNSLKKYNCTQKLLNIEKWWFATCVHVCVFRQFQKLPLPHRVRSMAIIPLLFEEWWLLPTFWQHNILKTSQTLGSSSSQYKQKYFPSKFHFIYWFFNYISLKTAHQKHKNQSHKALNFVKEKMIEAIIWWALLEK